MADDLGVLYTDKKLQSLEKKINQVYKTAQKDINKKLKDFTAKSAKKEKEYLKKVKDGTMTQEKFDKWKKGQMLVSENWKSQQAGIAKVLSNANSIATSMINGEKADVFAFNSNYQAYNFEHGFGADFGFDVYSAESVTRLLRDNPKILPKKKLDKAKDEAWNMRNMRSQITQGIVQGESIPKIAERLANVVPNRNKEQMIMHARTAMTSAQNGGRMERYKEAEALGIKFKKVWLATLDNRTRDTHQDLDGQAVKPEEYFVVGKDKLMFPGDPDGAPAEVYNCRCTLITELDDYPDEFKRRAKKEDGSYEDVSKMTYNEWYLSKTQVDANTPIKTLQTVQHKLQTQIDKLDAKNHQYSGIWKNQTVSYADYEAKKGSIQGKKDYYTQQLDKLSAQGITSGTEYDFYTQKLNELADFEKNGAKYEELANKLKETNQEILARRPKAPKGGTFSPDAYSQERRDKAMWASSPQEADAQLRKQCGDVWKKATAREKDGIYEYTSSFSKYNEPLRGIEYGTNRYLGVGNTDLNAGWQNNGDRLNAMTELLEKSTYTQDIWLQRGVQFKGMDKFFNCDMDLLQHGTEEQLNQALLGKEVTEFGFMSCGTSKGSGFSGGILLNVYAPSGTKMMYVEPISHYGAEMHQSGYGKGKNWDGEKGQRYFGSELETILQQGTKFTIEKIERSSPYGTVYMDLWVVDQSNPQVWTP